MTIQKNTQEQCNFGKLFLPLTSDHILVEYLTTPHFADRLLALFANIWPSKQNFHEIAIRSSYSHTVILPRTSFPQKIEGEKRKSFDEKVVSSAEFQSVYRQQFDQRKDEKVRSIRLDVMVQCRFEGSLLSLFTSAFLAKVDKWHHTKRSEIKTAKNGFA